jgi:hypothetical protein
MTEDQPINEHNSMTDAETAHYEASTDEQDAWWQFGYIVGQRAALHSLARLIAREEASFNALHPLEDLP